MRLYTDSATGTLLNDITASATTFFLNSGEGIRFPDPQNYPDEYALLTLENAEGHKEKVKLTSRSGDEFTVLRGQEGSVVSAYSAGSRCELRMTASAMSNMFQRDEGDVLDAQAGLGNRLYFKRYTVGGAKPAAGDLHEGEFAVNIVDKWLWVGGVGAAPGVPVDPVVLFANTAGAEFSGPVIVDLPDPSAEQLLTLDAETGHTGNIMQVLIGTEIVFEIMRHGRTLLRGVPGEDNPTLSLMARDDNLVTSPIMYSYLEDTSKTPQIFWKDQSEFLGTLRVRDPENDYGAENWNSGVGIGSFEGRGYTLVKSARSGTEGGQEAVMSLVWDQDGHEVQGASLRLEEGPADKLIASNLRLYHHGRQIFHSGTSNLNIGNLDSGYGLTISYVAGQAAHLHQVADGSDALYWQKSGVTNCVVRGNGAIYNSGGVFGALASSRSLKQDITPLDGSLAKVCALIPSSFAFKTEPDEPQVGFIAEELGEVLPDLLAHHDDGSVGVITSKLIPILVNAVQELTARVEELEAKLISDDLH